MEPNKTPDVSPFTVQKRTVKGKRAFYFILLFFLASLGGLGYASYRTFMNSRAPFVVFDIREQQAPAEKTALLEPQPPRKTQTPPPQKEEDSSSSLAEALAKSMQGPESKLKGKKSLKETVESAMLNYPAQKEIKDSAAMEENDDLPMAPKPSAAPKPKEPERVIDVKDEFAVRRAPLPKPDLIQDTLMASLPNFSAIKNTQSKGSIPLHIIEPLPELQTASRYGNIPVKKKNGETAFQAYSRSFDSRPQTPYIAVMISGLGKLQNTTNAAIYALPQEVSLSFSPYSEQLGNYVAEARRSGHETLLDLPMQRGLFPSTDPGPLGLVAGLPEQENRKRLHKTLGRNVAYIGMTATSGETFSYAGQQMKSFVQEINDRGLIYISGTDDPEMPVFPGTIRPDVHIMNNFYRSAIRARLEEARQIALQKGSAFIRAETAPIVLLTLLEWMNSFTPAEDDDLPEITFVPLSYYAKESLGKRK